MINTDTFVSDIKEISDKVKNLPEYTIEVTLTDECNFRCTYCFEGSECMKTTTLTSIEDISTSVDTMLLDGWFLSEFKGVRIGFWGGEPTLRPDLIRSFVEYFKDNELVRFHIYTNGYNVDQLMEAFDDCKDKINIQVSYDGEKIHDIKRQTAGQQKTASRVRENIYKLHENGFGVSIKSTVTYDTMEHMAECWDDIKNLADDIGEKIRYSPTVDYINDAGDIDMVKVRKCWVQVAKKELKYKEENGRFLCTWFESKRPIGCNFFRYGMVINTNGDFMYCHGCNYSSLSADMTFGNISDGDIIEKIKHNHKYFIMPERPDKCKSCLATHCCTCNVVKYKHSQKKDFKDRWYDLDCQQDQCDMFIEFSKVSISLNDLIGRK